MSSRSKELQRLAACLDAAGVATVALMFALGYFLFVAPARRSATDARSRCELLAGFLDSAAELRSENTRLQGELAARRDSLARVESRIPESAKEAEFLSLLSDAAGRCDVTLHDFRPLGIESRDEHSEMQIRLSGKGGFGNLCRFLEALRTSSRMNRVAVVEITRSGNDSTDCGVDLTLRLFYRNSAPARQSEKGGGSRA